VTVPPNTTATISLPIADADGVTVDGEPAGASELVRLLGTEDGRTAFAVESGTYRFESSVGL
jgi:hypothetical protein